MLAKSEGAVLTITVLGTLTACGGAASFTGEADPRQAEHCVQRSSKRVPGRRAVFRRREGIVRSNLSHVPCVSMTSAKMSGRVRQADLAALVVCQDLSSDFSLNFSMSPARLLIGHLKTSSDRSGSLASVKPIESSFCSSSRQRSICRGDIANRRLTRAAD